MRKRIWPLVLLMITATLAPALAQQATLQEEQDFRFAIQLENKGLFDLAALQFERFADSYPMSVQAPQALFRAAQNYEKADSLSRAARDYQMILFQYPQSGILDRAQFNYAALFEKNGERLKAALAFERIKIIDAKSELVPEAQIAAAKNFLAVGRYQQAYDAAYYILEMYNAHPLRMQAGFIIAQVHEAKGDYKQALAFLDRILGDRVKDDLAAQVYVKKAELLVKIGRYAQSDSVLNKLVFGDYGSPVVAKAAVALAVSAQKQRDFETAQKVLQEALAKVNAADNANILLTLGDNYYLQHQYEQAKTTYMKAAAMPEASRPLYHYRLGLTAKAVGDFAAAATEFAKTTSDSSVDDRIRAYAAVEYANALARAGRPVEGIRFLQRMTATTPDERGELFMTIAGLQEQFLGDYSGARQSYGAVIAGDPASPLIDDAQFRYAQTFEAQGEQRQALDEYQRYLTYYPGGDFVRPCEENIERLQFFAPPKNATSNLILDGLAAGGMSADSRASVALNLARYYLVALRDYDKALALLQQVKQQGGEQGDPARIEYDMALCHFALYESARHEKAPGKAGEHARALARIAGNMRENFPDSELAEQVDFWNVRANLPDISDNAERIDYLRRHIDGITRNDSLKQRLQMQLVDEMIVAADAPDSVYAEPAAVLDEIIESGNARMRAEALYKKALLLKQMAYTDSAAAVLGEMLAINDSRRRLDALFLMAALNEAGGNPDGARRLYEEIVQQYFYSNRAKKARIKLISLLLEQGRYAEAKQRVQALQGLGVPRELRLFYPQKIDDESMWLWAQVVRRTQPPQAAISEYQNYLDLGMNTAHAADALFAIGELADTLNKQEMALGYFRECAERFPADSVGQRALVRTADLYFKRGFYEQAGELYLKMKNELTGDLQKEAFKQYIICEYKQGRLSKATALVKQFKKQYDDRNAEARFLYEEGTYYVNTKNLVKAEKIFKSLTKYDDVPEGARGELGLARLYVIQTKTEDALKRLTKIPQKYDDPEIVATAYLNLADFYYENRALENTISAGRRVLELQESGVLRAQALDLLINAYDDLGMRDQAIAYERQYIEMYPYADDILDRRIRIGTFLYYLKEYDRAIAQLKELAPIVSADDEARVRFWIAESYAAAGFTEQAIIEYLKVRYQCKQTKLPFGVTALYKAGEGYRKLGNLPKAREMYEQVVRERGAADDFGRAATKKIQEIDAELNRQS